MENRHTRLLELADGLSVPLNISNPPLSATFNHTYVTDADLERAKALLIERRSTDPEYKAPKGVSKWFKKTEIEFSPREVNRAFADVVVRGGALGLVAALRELGGDVNVARKASKSILKKITQNDQQDCRSDVLRTAVQSRNLEIVRLLAPSADQMSRDESLLQAIELGHLGIVRVLLEHGANPMKFHDQFLAEVDKGREDMVELLMQGPKRPCMECRTRGLVYSVKTGSRRNASMLLLNEADADYQSAAALQLAVKIGRNDLAVAITLGQKPPSPTSLDLAVSVAYAEPDHGLEKKIALIEICLCGGAAGEHIAETLLKASERKQVALITLLLSNGASVDHKGGAVISHAILDGQNELLKDVLQRHPSPLSLSNAIKSATTLSDLSAVCRATEQLLDAGARGVAVDQALVTAVKRSSEPHARQLILLLLKDGNADVNFGEGKAIQLIASAGKVDVLQILLAYQPSAASVNASFPFAMKIQDASNRRLVVKMLLEAGAIGQVVDEALVMAAKIGADGNELTKLLLPKASLDYGDGEALVVATWYGFTDILELLLSANPSRPSLKSALATAQALKDDARLTAVELILRAGVAQDVCDTGLLQAVQEQPNDSRLVQIFLKAGASPEYSKGNSVLYAAGRLDPGLLELLAPAIHSKDIFSAALDVVIRPGNIKRRTAGWLSPEGLTTVQFLLEKGASGPSVYTALIDAARLANFEALQLLSTSVVSCEAYTAAFDEALNSGVSFLLNNIDIIELLLEQGAGGEKLHIALLHALEAYSNNSVSEALIDLLLHYKADINYNGGQGLKLAVSKGDISLLQKLLRYGASQECISLAFSAAIEYQHEEKCLIALIDTFMLNLVKPDVNFVHPSIARPPLISCMSYYPGSATIVKRMCDAGCNLETKITFKEYNSENSKPEINTPLTWALFQEERKRVSTEVISTLLESKANPNYRTTTFKVTPLIIAAKYGRHDVIKALLKHDAKVSVRDVYDSSALFYASRNGDIESMAAILKAKPSPDDGSLQEAAREFHAPAVKLLLKSGHHPDFPSTKHDGRTPLAELALRCKGSASDFRIDETINELVAGKVDPFKKCRGKNPLYLALENQSTLVLFRKLLDCIYWGSVNDPKNLYIKDDLYYSPTMYIKKDILRLSQSDYNKAVEILDHYNAEDIYYAKDGKEQPPDAVGMPERMVELERRKKVREEKIRQDQEDHDRRFGNEAATNQQRLEAHKMLTAQKEAARRKLPED